jgi:asparagine synthase (glutamine-hydrolysing)
MCGIAGFVNVDGAPAGVETVTAMMRAIRHRGPDDRGQLRLSLRQGTVAADPSAQADTAIGFHRLNILDLSELGHQPMLNESGTVAVAFNGEIYNAFDFRPELEAAGYRFRSRTDTEIILYLYEHYGLDGMLSRLNGMFAIVLADLRAREIHVARDHFGIKPFYWAQVGSAVLFASEVKAFLEHPAFAAEIDATHVDEQLAFRYVAGEATLFKGVRHLRPGHRLRITPDGVAVARYWSIPDGADKRALTRPQAVDELDALLRGSVKSQLLSDVKVGCQLSGGIDSSLVTLFARQHFGTDMDTFSIVFADPKFSEDRWVSQAAAAAGADSHRFMFTESTFNAAIERATWHMDQPISHPNSLGIWLLAQRSRELVTVLLSGEGADEVFGGYTRFYYAHLRPMVGKTAGRLGWVPSIGERLSRHFTGEPVETFVRTTQFQPTSKLTRLRPGADLAPAIARRVALFNEGGGDHLSNCLKYEMQTYLVDLLVRQDKMTMAHSLENRVPFLDRAVVDFARTLPAGHLVGESVPVSGNTMRATKVVVKELASRTFDDAFVYRQKSGFSLPLSQYFRSRPFTELMEDRLLPGMRQRGLVSEPAVRELWQRSLSAPSLTEPFWIPVALELWAQQFIDGRGRA